MAPSSPFLPSSVLSTVRKKKMANLLKTPSLPFIYLRALPLFMSLFQISSPCSPYLRTDPSTIQKQLHRGPCPFPGWPEHFQILQSGPFTPKLLTNKPPNPYITPEPFFNSSFHRIIKRASSKSMDSVCNTPGVNYQVIRINHVFNIIISIESWFLKI